MTRAEWQDKLSKQFGQLNTKLKKLGAENRNVFIPDYELIVPKILDLILDTELTEETVSSCKIVTAVDSKHRVAAEVRTALNNTALKSTLALFSDHELDKGYDRLIIVVLTFGLRISGDRLDKPFFKPQEDLWSLQTLYEKVSALKDVDKAESISHYLDQMLAVSFERPEHTLPSPPSGTDTFVGRATELHTLRRMLCTKKQIFITGIGGIGKTELVLRMAELYAPPKGAFFIRYDGSANKNEQKVIRHMILNAQFCGYQYSGWDNDTRDQEYAERLDILRKEYRDALLIIDNFDLSKKSMQEVFQEAEFYDLVSTGAYLVFTTRYTASGSLEILRLEDEELKKFMCLFLESVSVENDDLQKLIDAVDGHTYMVEMMARTIGKSWCLIEPQNFLDAFEKYKLPDEWCPDISTERNGLFESKNIYSHLSAVFGVSDLLEVDKCILRYASLLPVNGMVRELFWNAVTACEEDKFRNEDETGKENIINLITARGWLRRESNILTMHPVIRMACREKLKPTDDNCADFLDELWLKYNTQKYSKKNFPQLAELFEMATKIIEDREGICSLRAGLFWDRLGEYRKALLFYQETVRRQESSGSNAVDLVRTYNKIASAYSKLNELQNAYENFLKALEMAEKNPVGDNLAITYNNIGIFYGDLGNYEKALEYKLKALRIRETLYPAGHPSCAASYNNVGSAYSDLGDYKKALEYSLKALEIRESTRSSDDDLNLAASYNNVGGNYMRLGSYSKALDYLLKALFIREQFLPYDHPDLATSYNNVGGLYRYCADYEKALQYFMKALEIRKRVLPQNHPDIAQTYGNIARTYCSLGSYSLALEYINSASAIAKATGHRDQNVYQNAEVLIQALLDNNFN